MKVLHIGFSDRSGGAAIGMMRLHNSLKNIDVNSKVLVNEKLTNSVDVIGPSGSIEMLMSDIKIILARQKKFFYNFNQKYSHSLNIFSSNILKKIKKINPDIVNLHWINNEQISIKDISKINKPIVWTFHDMWPMCGGEHYTDNDRFVKGYQNTSKDISERGFDINKYLWNKKKNLWSSKINHVICGSNWLKSKAEKSYLFKNNKISIIPPALDEKEWVPVDKIQARKILKLPLEKKILLFMSTNGSKDERKGFIFIEKLFDEIFNNNKNIILLNVGNEKNEKFGDKIININKSFNGDPLTLKLIYSAADLLLAPSLLEAFGQVAIESASCGTPAIAFKNTGLEDTIIHKKTGYLANYMDQKDFNNGVNWILNELENNRSNFFNSSINFTKDNFSTKIIAKKYYEIYNSILNSN